MIQLGGQSMISRRLLAQTFIGFAASLVTHPVAAQMQESQIIAEMRKRGTIRIATLAGNPPYSTFKADGTPSGYDIEIGQLLAAALKVKPEWIVVDAPGRITVLQNGKADASIANFTDTIERSISVAFTRPYIVVGSVLMVSRASALQTVEQANQPGIKVASLRGGTSDDVAAKITPNATLVSFSTVTEAFQALRAGQVDVQILDSLLNAAFLAREGGKFRNLPGNWSYEEICIGVPAGDVDWLRIVDTFVRQLVNSGENARLFKKYFGFDIPSR